VTDKVLSLFPASSRESIAVTHDSNMSRSQQAHTEIFVRDVRFSPVHLAARIHQRDALLELFCVCGRGISRFVLERFSEESEAEEPMAIKRRMASIAPRLAATP
jgi:hypothetical protein